MREQEISAAELREIMMNGSPWIITGGSSASTHRGTVSGFKIGENESHRLTYHNGYKRIEFQFSDKKTRILNLSGSKVRLVSRSQDNEILVLEDLTKLDKNKEDEGDDSQHEFLQKVRRSIGENFTSTIDDTRNELLLTADDTVIRIPLDLQAKGGVSISVGDTGSVTIAVERETNECELCGTHKSYSVSINGKQIFNKSNH
jgi:hypothetical protein